MEESQKRLSWDEISTCTIAEYVWIDGSGQTMRSKCKTLPGLVSAVEDLPDWDYDGSSCYQASTENSEVVMRPVAVFRDPFRKGNHILVLTETYKRDKAGLLIPTESNLRAHAREI